MKKTGAKRVSGFESGLGSAVLTAPEESFASAGTARKGPAPAGALQRGFGREYDEQGADAYRQDDSEYVPQRGKARPRFAALTRSVGGRIALGVGAIVVLGGAVVAFAGVHSYLMHDARFVVASSDDIQITGAEHLTRDQIVSAFGPDLERNIFRVSLAERQEDLERLPWVAHATVMRLLPDVLRVQITERTPVAFVRQGSQIGLVDGSGVLLDMPADAAGDPHYSFPVLTGLSANEALSERAAKMEVYEQFLHELDGSGARLTDSVSEVDVADPEDVKALITSGSSDVLVHFGQEDFLKRYKEFEDHLPEWKQQYPKLASADMRYEGQIVLEMQGDGHATAVGADHAEMAKAESAPLSAPLSAPPVAAAPVVATRPAAISKPAARPLATTKPAAPKSAAPKSAAVKSAAVKSSGVKPAGVAHGNASAAKPAVAGGSKPAGTKTVGTNPLASDAPMPRAAAPRPVNLNAAGLKPVATAKTAPVKTGHAAAKAAGSKAAGLKKPSVKARPGSGMSAANEKVFARLAAEHRAQLAKEHKAATVSKNGKAAARSGATK